MDREFVTKVYRQGGPPPHGFKTQLSEDVVQDPETGKPVTIYYILFKNSDFQKLPRKQLVDVSVWLKKTHDVLRGYGIRALIQPIFDTSDNLTPEKLAYKLQEIRKKK